MIKKELRKLPRLYVTDEMAEFARGNGSVLFLRAQKTERYLTVAVYLPIRAAAGVKTPYYEVFIDIDKAEWITRSLDDAGQEEKWLTAMFWNLPEISWRFRNKQYMDSDTEKIIGLLPGDQEEKGAERIHRWQESINKRKIQEKEKKEQIPWDADMALIPPAPDAFVEWLGKECPTTNYIIYEYRKGGAKTAYCVHCGKDVILHKRPHYGDREPCPDCGVLSEYLSNRKRRLVHTDGEGQIIQEIPGGFVIRKYLTYLTVRMDDYRQPKRKYKEIGRTLYRGGQINQYEYTVYKNKFERWVPLTTSSYLWLDPSYWGSKSKIYRKNLPDGMKVLESGPGLAEVIRSGRLFDATAYLYHERRHPLAELFVKAGLVELALIYEVWHLVDESQTTPARALKLDRARMARLKSLGQNIYALLWLQEEKKENTVWDNEMLSCFVRERIKPSSLDFLKGLRLSIEKIYHYLFRQQAQTKEIHLPVGTWRDYMEMAKKLKMDTSKEMISKPKNLKAAHDELVELLQKDGMQKTARNAAKKFPQVDVICQTLQKYEYSDGVYCIKAPKGIYDIVREGTLLRHCIHTCDYYFDRISRRESYLLFLRLVKAEAIPWYTLEVEPGGNIRQKRTTGDNQNKDLNEALPFLRAWQKEVKKRMDEEEKNLAKVSAEKRKENLAELRKNGNTIWHGRLQGQLLADVLAKDFMEVI